MSKFRYNQNLLTVAICSAFAASAHAGFDQVCSGPNPRVSNDYGFEYIESPLFSAVLGISGTYAYNDGNATPIPGCFSAAITGQMAGRLGFGAGLQGSMHTSIDDDMGFTWGFPFGVVGTSAYAIVREDNTTSVFGTNGFQLAFTGSSDTYFFGRTTNGNVRIDLRVDLVADSARCNWTMINTDTVSHTVGLGFGSTVTLFSGTQGDAKGAGPRTSDSTYVMMPGIKPPRTERRFRRALDPAGYPSSVMFNWSQGFGYGLQVMNTADVATTDLGDPTQSQTPTDIFTLGNAFFLIGWAAGTSPTSFPDFIFGDPISDVDYLGDDGYIQTWNPQTVAAGGQRVINAFYRSTWGDSLYSKPYSVVSDTPKVINLDQNDANQFAQNPFPIRVWVDNNRGFATIDQELPLQDVRVELLLPDGLTPVGASVKTITNINARAQGFVDFMVQADSFAAGELTYQVRITPTPGPQKTLTGVITVISQPKIILRNDANLITSPWTFASPTWETILGLVPDADYQAFAWDPIQKGYIISTGPERGKSQWIVSKVGTQNITLGGDPTAPTDYQIDDPSGGPALISLKPGWNLIGNPYHVAIQLGELVGASNTNPNSSYTYVQLVQQGLISGSLAYWDTGTQNYGFIQKTTDKIEPQRGYWIYVFASQDVVVRFPAVFMTNFRGNKVDTSKPWQQTDKQWRLQLAARSNSSADDQNYLGRASSADNAKSLRIYEPPMAPLKGALSLSIEKPIDGTTTRLAQSLTELAGRQEFIVKVDSREAGAVTVTWPNLSTIPKNVRAKLVDVATGESRDLRKVSGYTFQAEANLTREFKIQIEPGTVSKAIIGNVTAIATNRGTQMTSIRMNYTLGSDATTTVRVLGPSGKEVMTLSAGRADKAGQNEVVWNLRDQANRSVAPGTYRVEIVAEGQEGERVRKITPIVVTR